MRSRWARTNVIRMHIAEQGSGPLVLLCHGFPESWYSWRHQLSALAAAGYHAVAPDMRGYGQTDQPQDIAAYTLLHTVHGRRARRPWRTKLRDRRARLGGARRVERRCALTASAPWVGLSVPFRPRGAVRPTTVMPKTADAIFYMLYFQEPGVAEAELGRDPRSTIRRILYSGSGESPRPTAQVGAGNVGMVPRAGGFLSDVEPPATLPWLTEADIDFYAGEFARTGFRGGLNWYRNIDRNWELLSPWAGANVSVPALYLAGERDLVLGFGGTDKVLASLKQIVPNLRQARILPGCGHWTQRERPAEVNAAVLEFLKTL